MAGLYTGFETSVTESFYNTGLDWMEPSAQTVTNAAQEQGWRYTGWDSIRRYQEQTRAQSAGNRLKELGYTSSSAVPNTKNINMYGEEAQGDDFIAKRSRNPVTSNMLDLMEEYGATSINMISKETLNNDPQLKELGLTFDVDSTDLEVSMLMARKKNEIRNRYVLQQANGGRYAKGFLIEMGMAVLDPVGVVAGLFAMPFTVTMVGGRAVQVGYAGAIKLGVKAAALTEIPIYSQAQKEQADYGMYESMINVAFGGVVSGGLHGIGRGISNYHAKRLAVKQLAENEQIKAAETADVLDSDEPEIRSPEDIQKEINKRIKAIKKKKKLKSTKDAGEQEVEIDGQKAPIGDISKENLKELKVLLKKKAKKNAADLKNNPENFKADSDLAMNEANLKKISDYEKQVKDGEKAALNKAEMEAEIKELEVELEASKAQDPETILRDNIKELEDRVAKEVASENATPYNVKYFQGKLDSARKNLESYLSEPKGKPRKRTTGQKYIEDTANTEPGRQFDPQEKFEADAKEPTSDDLFASAEKHIRATASMTPEARKQALDDLAEMKKAYLRTNELDKLEDGLEQLINCGK